MSWLVTCLCLACPPAWLRQVLILVPRVGAANRVINLSLGVNITKAILNTALVWAAKTANLRLSLPIPNRILVFLECLT